MSERAIATFAETLGAILAAGGFGLLDADWVGALSAAAMATLLAVLKAFAALGVGGETGASFGTAIPKGAVAAVETNAFGGKYEAEEAAPYREGTPVDVVPDADAHNEPTGYPDFDHEIDGPADGR